MNFLEWCRNKSFWILDSIKGGKVASYLSDLSFCEDGNTSEGEIDSIKENELKELLNHTIQTVPFYKNMSSLNLQDWPVVNKSVIRNNYEAFCSNKFDKEDLIHMSTSGSTGTPFECLQNIDKKKSVNAETLYYNGKVGFKIGRRIIYLRSVVSETSKSKLQQFMQNIYLLDCTDLSDKGIEEKLKFIKA